MPDARKTVANALIRVEKESAFSNVLLANLLREAQLSREDTAFASALFYGVLDRKITLDYLISRYIRIRVEKLKPLTRQALRMALYQIRYMDRVPDHAAVGQSVELVKHSPESHNAPFVNGVLRNYLRNPADLPSGSDEKSLAIRYSCPPEIVGELTRDYGEAAEGFLQSFLQSPSVHLRVNPLKTDAGQLIRALAERGIAARETDPYSVCLLDGMDIRRDPGYQNGWYHAQDPASQACASLLGAKPGEKILDLCAAPGGKTFTVAEQMQNRGKLLSCDLYDSRVKLIVSGAARLGLTCITARQNDAAVYCPDFGTFDRVLCDVPCSGYGILRRKPDIKYKPSTDFSALQQLQAAILETGSRYVQPGGVLMYSTCTLRKKENENQVAVFLKKHPEYRVDFSKTFFPDEGTDGFFVCRMLRE